MDNKKYLIRRYLLFALALFVNAMGIAYITKASLGTSPITSVTYVASMFTPFTMGQWTIILNFLFLLIELPLMTRAQLRSDLRMFLLQIPVTLFFGTCIDLSMNLLYWLSPLAYAAQVVHLLIGCVILALGIALEVKADVALMAATRSWGWTFLCSSWPASFLWASWVGSTGCAKARWWQPCW